MKRALVKILVYIGSSRTLTITSVLFLFALLNFGCGGEKSAHQSEHSESTTATTAGTVERSVEDSAVAAARGGESNSHQSGQPKDSATKQKQAETESSDSPVEEKRGVTGEDEACGEITDARIKAGATLFVGKGNCFTCHKGNGTGSALGPDLTDKTWIHISGDYSSIINNIRTGVKLPVEYPTPMPAMGGAKLTDEEVCAVAAYVWSLSQ